MQAVKKPIPITVIRVEDATYIPEGVSVRPRIGGMGGELEVFNALHAAWIGFQQGDYLNISTPGDVYPINREVFDKTYDIIRDAV